ncbi:hypothetical protein NDU88_008420 [Pleurodeles waltl]|uniref:Uncharacterized protein n=1 Tax=Pleurodeles waltl TaxID=8319 RepID=A0AAV7PQC1_PLEWA|nr:hypothetical protein NDU88_008420 [Pleurodeles waltl]
MTRSARRLVAGVVAYGCSADPHEEVGARTEIVSKLTQLEDELGLLEREVILDDNKAERLQEVGMQHAELLERLPVIDYRSYMQKMHAEADKPGGTWSEPTVPLEPMTIVTAPISFRYFERKLRQEGAAAGEVSPPGGDGK